jgi:hypothetical protein
MRRTAGGGQKPDGGKQTHFSLVSRAGSARAQTHPSLNTYPADCSPILPPLTRSGVAELDYSPVKGAAGILQRQYARIRIQGSGSYASR